MLSSVKYSYTNQYQNIFLITSTINTSRGLFETDLRFQQTLLTIKSIRKQAPNSAIVFCDNSLDLKPEYIQQIENLVDFIVPFTHNIFSKYIQKNVEFSANISLGEFLLYEKLFNFIKQSSLKAKRIFKISGRYVLSDRFDLGEYDSVDMIQRYVFRERVWQFSVKENDELKYIFKTYYETRLWSMDFDLLDDFFDRLPGFFEYCILNGESIEPAIKDLIPPSLVYVKPVIHLNGVLAKGPVVDE